MWPIWSRDPCYAPLRDSRRSSVTDTVTRSMRHAYYTPLRGGGRSRVANWSRGLCYTPPRGGVRLSVTYVVTQSMILAATRWRQVERDLLIHAATRDGGRSSVTHVVTPPSCLLALPCLLVRRYRLVTGGSRESRDAELVSPSFTFTATWPPRGAGTRIHAIGTARAATRSRHIEHDRCGLAAVQMLRAVPR